MEDLSLSEEIVVVDPDMRHAVAFVEGLLDYSFRRPKLLVDALTHASYQESASYERLEFVGDAVLGLALTNHIFLANPRLDPGQLTLLRAANVSTEKLARVAVRHGLYQYVRRNAPTLDEQVREFATSISEEPDEMPYTGVIKAPKVLADIVEAIAAAVYVDINFDLMRLWLIFRGILEPIVTLETLPAQPVTFLYEYCQKKGLKIDIKHMRKGGMNMMNVLIDGNIRGSGCHKQKDIAKLDAVKEAVRHLIGSQPLDMDVDRVEPSATNGAGDQDGSKKRLHELCTKNRWPKPIYRVEKEIGPAHERQFMCSVQVETSIGAFYSRGNTKSRVKDAENSAAFMILNALHERSDGRDYVADMGILRL